MPAFNVYMAALGSHGLTSDEQTAIQSSLQSWFTQITTGTSYGSAMVSWATAAPASIQSHELLIYFVSSSFNSVVTALPGRSGSIGSSDGFTAWAGTMTASEVYVSSSRGYLSQLAFHELMHNKLHLGDAALHAKNGLARLPVAGRTSPSPANISDMRSGLSASQTQWTGGWTASIDPLAGL